MFGAIARRQLRKACGRRTERQPQIIQRTFVGWRQTTVTRVFQFFATNRQCNVDRAGRHRVSRATQRLGARRAHVFHAADRNAIKTQCERGGNCGVADVDVVERGARPCGIDLLAFNARIGQRFVEGFRHQQMRRHIPTLAEYRATHAKNGDFVFNA